MLGLRQKLLQIKVFRVVVGVHISNGLLKLKFTLQDEMQMSQGLSFSVNI